MAETTIAGKHGFDGSCAPGSAGVLQYSVQETFSVGIFQWLAKASGRGCKRSAVKVRVKEPFGNPSAVYAKANEIVAALDAGAYVGPKNVTVS